MEKSFLGNTFDFNNDGHLDTTEKTVDFLAFAQLNQSFNEKNISKEINVECPTTIIYGNEK